MWSTSEYHKLQNPHPKDEDYSHTYQKAYFSYTLALAGIGFVTALSTTLIFLFPPLSIPLLIASGIVIAGLSIVVAEIWLSYTFGNHQPTPVSSASHQQIMEALGPKEELEEINFLAPYHGTSVLQTRQHQPHPDFQQELDELSHSAQQTCPMAP